MLNVPGDDEDGAREEEPWRPGREAVKARERVMYEAV